jgi:hypothetical protein
MWRNMERAYGRPGLAFLEQKILRSVAEKRCASCGAPGTVLQRSGLVRVVRAYWMCQPCHAHYEAKKS